MDTSTVDHMKELASRINSTIFKACSQPWDFQNEFRNTTYIHRYENLSKADLRIAGFPIE
jgi:hypothetical protein